MLSPNVETFLACDNAYEEAKLVIFGAPFDSTTSYRPGTRFGPSAIRHESFGIETYSPYQDKDLEDYAIFDSGDLELCFGSSELALKDIEERAEIILNDGKFPLMIGGEHLVTLGAVRAALKKYPDLHVIHFDAHADLRDEYLGVPLSHACVLRRCHDLLGDGRIHQFCIRSGEREEFRFASQHTDMHKFSFDGLAEIIMDLKERNVPIYFTIDLDCLDPGFFPGTGTPEAGGVSFPELLNAILTVTQGNVIAADVNELAPNLDQSGASTALACKITRELMLAICDKSPIRETTVKSSSVLGTNAVTANMSSVPGIKEVTTEDSSAPGIDAGTPKRPSVGMSESDGDLFLYTGFDFNET